MKEIIRESPYRKSNKVKKMEKVEELKECSALYAKKTFAETPRRFSKEVKYKAILMYLNNVGIRKIALILGVSSGAVSKWIRNAHKLLQELLENVNPLASEKADNIELDEIYTYVKKSSNRMDYFANIFGCK